MTIRVSEIFRSVQGEGNLTGNLSIWVRFAGCNLHCNGFSQKDPADSSTWVLPQFDKAEGKKYKSLNDLPVLTTGCDSYYSWHPQYKHLFTKYETSEQVFNEAIKPLLYDNEKWAHPKTNNFIDLCFTGGEPMLWQTDLVNIAKRCCQYSPYNYPRTIQIETNGTKPIEKKFTDWYKHGSFMLNWNISPKLLYVSGELSENAWKPEIILDYYKMSSNGCLKFVMIDDPRAWDELEVKISKLKVYGIDLPTYIMPVGATKEQQEESDVIGKIASEAIDRGYHVSGRMHAILWKNTVGV